MTGGIDPKNVKPGDMVTLSRGNSTARGAVTHVQDFLHLEELGRYRVKGLGDGTRTGGYTEWTLTAHQPAPEPEPEWKPGTVAEIEVDGGDLYRAIKGDVNGHWHTVTGDTYGTGEVTDVRQLVVLDPAVVDEVDLQMRAQGALENGLGLSGAVEVILARLGLGGAR